MRTAKARTAGDIRQEFKDRGESISDWAVRHRFNPNLVFMVLSGRSKGIRGQSHRISVALGLKRGTTAS